MKTKIFPLSLILISTISYAEPQKENWISLMAGKSEQAYTHHDYKLEASYEFDVPVFVKLHYEISEEQNGGIDNNIIDRTGVVYTLGYVSHLDNKTNLLAGISYVDITIENKEKGGVRWPGDYSDIDIDGKGLLLGISHAYNNSIDVDAKYEYFDYSTDVDNHIVTLGANYSIYENTSIRAEYMHIESSSPVDVDAWKAGLRFDF